MATGPGFQKIPNMYAECDFGRVKLIRDDDVGGTNMPGPSS